MFARQALSLAGLAAVFASGCFPEDALHDATDATIRDARTDLGSVDATTPVDVRRMDAPPADVRDAGSATDTGPGDTGPGDTGPMLGTACDMAPATASSEMLFDGLTNPRDFVFDGTGAVVIAQGANVLVRRLGVVSPLASVPSGEIVALRYTRRFGLVMAVVVSSDAGTGTTSGSIYQLTPGASTPVLRQGGLRRPGGLAIDDADGIWFSDTAANTVYRMPGDPMAAGAMAVITDINGPTQLLVDGLNRYLFVARTGTDPVMRVELGTDGGLVGRETELVAGLMRVSGLAEDQCGNVFVADEIQNRIWRVPIDTSLPSSRFVTDVSGPRALMFGSGSPYGPRELYGLSSMDGSLRGANLVALGYTLPVPAP